VFFIPLFIRRDPGRERARALEIASAGHYPFLTHSSVFNAGLIEFLGSVEA